MTFLCRLVTISFLLSACTAFTMSPIPTRPAYVNAPRFSTRNSYDMGIGKHQPLDWDGKDQSSNNDDDIYHAANFMVEYESIHRFPSPLDRSEQEEKEEPIPVVALKQSPSLPPAPTSKPSTQVSLPKVEPKRQLEDVLFILQQHDETETHPIMTHCHSVNRHQELDVNSIWVEMLIHSQTEETPSISQKLGYYVY